MKRLFLSFVLLSNVTLGADVCIRSGGSGSGASWSDALSALPGTVYRTNTYWLGNGSITMPASPVVIVPTTFSGTHLKIFKATTASHGPSTGWSDAYDAQAVPDRGIEINYSGWFIDGVRYPTNIVTRGGIPSDYGILWENGGENKLISFGRNLQTISDNNIIRGIWFNAIGGTLPGVDVARYHLDFYSAQSSLPFRYYTTNYVGYCGFTNGSVCVFMPGNSGYNSSSNNLIENCYMVNQAGNGANHAEPIDWYYTVHESVVRNCVIKGSRGGVSAIVAVGGNSTPQYGNELYGCLIYDCEISVLLGFGEADRSNQVGARIYNNTIADRAGDCCSSGIDIYTGSDNLVFNNYWINTESGFAQRAGIVHTNNGYSWNYSSTGEIPNVPTSIFTDYAAKNFIPTTNYFSGASIAGMYPLDMLGNYRGGTNGTLTVGAFQIVAASTNTPAPPVSGTWYINNARATRVIVQ